MSIRLATVQVGDAGSLAVSGSNPFDPKFTLEAARARVRRRMAAIEELVQEAGRLKCDLAVTTETLCGLSPYRMYRDDPSVFEKLQAEFEPLAREKARAWSRNLRLNLVICEHIREAGRYYNAGLLFGRGGALLGTYRKVHLSATERWSLTPGDGFPAFETDLGKVGINICYDQRWAEATLACALNGARIVCMPSGASPPEFRVRTRALDNGVFFLTSTGVHSMIAAPGGEVLADARQQSRAVVYADVDLATATLAKKNFWDALYSGVRDHRERHFHFRMPQAYGVISEPDPPLAGRHAESRVADSREEIQRIYEEHKRQQKKLLAGEAPDYTWAW